MTTTHSRSKFVLPTWLRGLSRPGKASAFFLVAVALCAVLAPAIAPFSPTDGQLANSLQPPAWVEGGSSDYLLGTDNLGRDILSRLLYGARVSLVVAGTAIFLAASVGTLLGMIAGFVGGVVETVIMRLVDLTLALPIILLAFVLAVLVGPSFSNVIAIMAFVLWGEYARQVRAETLSLRSEAFVDLARVAGVSTLRILLRHILPNLFATVLVLATLQVGQVILVEAALSFLGVGIPPPAPAWGLMVSDGRGLIRTAWWLALFPGVAITATILALNILSDSLRDVLDPRGERWSTW